jgi:ribosomal protein S18 acetylase RimI-like enzyme
MAQKPVMEIRVLTESDTDAFLELRLEGLERDPKAFVESPEEHRARPRDITVGRLAAGNDDSFVLGAFEQNRLVGVVGFLRNEKAKYRHKAYIWGMYVTQAARGRGIGRELMRTLLDRARKMPGLEQITLSVTVSQSAAKQLYESLGFEVFGREPNSVRAVGETVDEEHMVLRLVR